MSIEIEKNFFKNKESVRNNTEDFFKERKERIRAKYGPEIDFLTSLFKDEESYVIGGVVRDAFLGVKKENVDIDVQAKVEGSYLEELLTQKGFIKTTNREEIFEESKFYIGNKGVFNIFYHSKEIQILPVGNAELDELTRAADLNLNCVAYSLEKNDFLNKRFIPDLFKKRLSFVDYEKVDLSKVLSALKFLSRNLGVSFDKQSFEIAKKEIAKLTSLKNKSSSFEKKIKSCFGNINSEYVVKNFFDIIDNDEVKSQLERIKEEVGDFKIDGLNIVSIGEMSEDLREKLKKLSIKKRGAQFDEKRFLKKADFVFYEEGENNNINSFATIDSDRIYTAVSNKTRGFFDILEKLNLNIGGLWTTVHESSAKMAVLIERKSNMRIIDNKEEMIELLVAKYPSYDKDDFIIDTNSDGHLVFSRKDKDYKQLLLVSS